MEPCKKCGTEMPPKVEWHESLENNGRNFLVYRDCEGEEHLHYTCPACRYQWTGPTKDQKYCQGGPTKYPESRELQIGDSENVGFYHMSKQAFVEGIKRLMPGESFSLVDGNKKPISFECVSAGGGDHDRLIVRIKEER